MGNIVSAVFSDRADAENAVNWLRQNGASEDAITVVSQQEGQTEVSGGAEDSASDAGKRAMTGAAVGAGVGALFGLAALAIPGIGPFITAGALANALGVTGGAVASGAIVGGTSGGLAGALSGWGVSEDDAKHYASEVENGGTYVGIEVSQGGLQADQVRGAFQRFNGTIQRQMAA